MRAGVSSFERGYFTRKKKQFYAAEFADFFRGRLSQSLAATIFLFFANITSIITFGAVMERALHHQMVYASNTSLRGKMQQLCSEMLKCIIIYAILHSDGIIYVQHFHRRKLL